LAATEALSEGFASIGRFADLDITNDKITEGFVKKSSAIAKVQIIANEETWRAVANVSNELSAAYLRLFLKRVRLVDRKQDLEILDEQVVSFGKERDRMLELMKQHNLEGVVDEHRWGVIQNGFDFEQKRISEALERRTSLEVDLFGRQSEIAREAIEELMKLSELLVSAVVAVRRELGLPINEVTYTQIVQELIAKQRTNLGEFLEQAGQFVIASTGAVSNE
jgi:hypothetical protein